MILLDMNQISIANIMIQHKDGERLDINRIRHMILDSLRLYNKQFKRDYGEMVLCYDVRKTWRYDVFPYYKANRNKDKNPLFWEELYAYIEQIKDEIKQYLPYKVMQVEECEADDVIAVLARQFSSEGKKVLIVSSDKDYQQLQKYANIEQFSPRTKEFMVSSHPTKELWRHILSGDRSDGIPNILSDDDTFIVPKKRQKPLTENRKEDLLHGIPPKYKRNFKRNEELIDFDMIPERLEDRIIGAYYIETDREKQTQIMEMINTFPGLQELLDVVGDFYNYGKKSLSFGRVRDSQKDCGQREEAGMDQKQGFTGF